MITAKTVFILGAGASKPYGFPTALELRKDIIHKFPNLYKKALAELNSIESVEDRVIERELEFINIFKNSSIESIDLFLTRNNKYYKVGKDIIIFMIAYYETQSKFREDIEYRYDWYSLIYRALTKDITNAEELENLFYLNNVSFITFNYDRSLEYFLYESLFNSFISQRNELKKLMTSLNYIHVYGKIVPLPWENNRITLKYGEKDFLGWIEELRPNIKIIYEERDDRLEKAKQLISEAKNIYFLGFGYADENLSVLDFNNLLNEQHIIFGTGLGFTENELSQIEQKLKGKNSQIKYDSIIIEDLDSVMLLRKHLNGR